MLAENALAVRVLLLIAFCVLHERTWNKQILAHDMATEKIHDAILGLLKNVGQFVNALGKGQIRVPVGESQDVWVKASKSTWALKVQRLAPFLWIY